jgi:hypothetical protein
MTDPSFHTNSLSNVSDFQAHFTHRKIEDREKFGGNGGSKNIFLENRQNTDIVSDSKRLQGRLNPQIYKNGSQRGPQKYSKLSVAAKRKSC